MKRLDLRSRMKNQFVEIPVDFLDIYLADAPEMALKIYLYLLRASSDPSMILSIPEMADIFDTTQKKIAEAIHYWSDLELFSVTQTMDGTIEEIILLPLPEKEKAAVSMVRETLPPSAAPVQESPAVIDFERVFTDPDFAEILGLAECYLAKVSHPMQEALAYAFSVMDKKTDIVEYLLEYCIDKKKSSPNYLKATVDAWKAEGYASLSEIKKANAERNKSFYSILNAFGIKNREAAPSEAEYLQRWTEQFDLPLILEACRRTMENLHAPDFRYTDAILKSWKENNVLVLSDVSKLDELHSKEQKAADRKPTAKTNFHNFTERSNTNYNELIQNHKRSS